MSGTHFGFTKLLVVDLDKAAAFYRDVFGVRETGRIKSEIAGRPIEEILFSPTGEGGATLVLLHYIDATEPSSSEVILGFLTPDADALIERALAAGGAVVREPTLHADIGVKVGFITDIENHLIEVVQPVR